MRSSIVLARQFFRNARDRCGLWSGMASPRKNATKKPAGSKVAAAAKSAVTLSRERVKIGLDDRQRSAIVGLLGQVLGDQHVLYLKLRNVHWNIVGARFHELHEVFEGQYTGLALAIDAVAERIRKLGGVAPGSMAEMIALSSLQEVKGELLHGDKAIKLILDDHETVIRALRKHIDTIDEDLGDIGTADFLTDLIREHEKAAWMLRVYLD